MMGNGNLMSNVDEASTSYPAEIILEIKDEGADSCQASTSNPAEAILDIKDDGADSCPCHSLPILEAELFERKLNANRVNSCPCHSLPILEAELFERKLNANRVSSMQEEPVMTIPRIPERLRQVDNDSYEPRIISIGPYHRGKSGLQPMEKLKWRCLEAILNRKKGYCLTKIIDEAGKMESQARSCYLETIEIESRDFVEMTVLDGCFIIEYLKRVKSNTSLKILENRAWMEPMIRNELLLLENQLPFFVLRRLYGMVTDEDPDQLWDLAFYFFGRVSPISTKVLNPVEKSSPNLLPYFFGRVSHISTEVLNPVKKSSPNLLLENLLLYHSPANKSGANHLVIRHLLHLYRLFLFPGDYDMKKNHSSGSTDPSQKAIWTVSSATTLEEAGIKFQMTPTCSELEVKFIDGVMKITPLVLDAFIISQFRNLIAFEKFDPYMEPWFTAFAKFMDYIIDTSKDVALLRKNGIIQHAFGSDDEVATIFNQLTGGTFDYVPLELEPVYRDVKKYSKNKINFWRAILLRNYFGNPWAGISLLAAAILLSFAFLQTFFSMYSYFRPPSSS